MGTWVQPHKQAACVPVTQDPAHGIAEVLRLLPAALGCSWSSSTTDPHQEPLGTSCRQAPTFCLQTFPRVVRFSPTACPRSGCIFFFFWTDVFIPGTSCLKSVFACPLVETRQNTAGEPAALPAGRCGARRGRWDAQGSGGAAGKPCRRCPWVHTPIKHPGKSQPRCLHLNRPCFRVICTQHRVSTQHRNQA